MLWSPREAGRPYAYLLVEEVPDEVREESVRLVDDGVGLSVGMPQVRSGWQLLRVRVPAGTAVDVGATLADDPAVR